MKLAINQPPEGGSCTVNNTVGVAFTDVWHLRCTGWFDMDGITMYQFYAVFRDEPMERHLSYDVKDEIMTVLPAGPEYDNYAMTLKVRIADEMKAVTEVTIGTVQVIPPSVDDLESDFTRLLATDQSQKVKAQGDILEMNQEYLKLASALNMARETNRQGNPEAYTVESTRTSGYGPRYKFISQAVNASNLTAEEQERVVQAARDRRAMMREAMSEALTNVTKSTVESIQLSVSTISVLTEAPEELTRKSQDSLSKSLKNMSQTLYDLSDDTPREEVIRTSTNLISASGGVFQASMVTLNHGTNIDIKRATQGAHYEYDTSLEAETMRLDGYGKATATEMFQKEANKLEQEDAAPEIVSNLMDTLNRTTGAIMKNSIPGEEKVKLVTPRLSYSLQMDTAQKVLNKTVEEGDAKAEFPEICHLVNRTNCSSDQVITLRTMATPTNMYRYVPNGENAPEISGTLSLDMYNEMHEEMYIEEAPSPLTVHIPRDPNIDISDATNVTAFIIHKKNVNLFFRSFFIKSHSASVHIEVTPDDPTARLLVLGRFGGKFPRLNGTDRAWDFMRVVPDDTPPTENICGTPKRNEIFLDNNFVNNRTGKVVLGFRRITPEEYKEYERGEVPEVTDPASGLVNTTFQLRTYTSGCYYYDKDRLSASGCRVCADTTHTMTVCQCNHMTTFAGGWAVQPNSLDWDFVFSHMDFSKNPTLYVTMINITILYVGFAVWARYQDKKDLEKLGVTPLEDNDPDDKYLYEVIFVTGGRKNAGTDSQVQFILSGELDETDVRMVSDKKRKILRRGSTNSFLMATPRPLGSLNYCRVWHDNSGQGKFASWYLNHIIVHDLQTRDRHYFICNRWFAVEEGDGQVDRTIPVASPEQMSAFAHLFGQQTRKNLGDEHLWFSVIARPPTSRFTRLQRVSCCLCLLYTSMLANAVFYDRVPDAAAPGQQAYTLGPFALSMEQIYVGIISNLMVFPINFLIVLLFRKARPRHKRPSRIQEALRKQGAGPGSTLAEIKLDLGVLDKPGLVTTDTPYKTDAKPITAMPRPSVSSVTIEATDGIKKKKKRKFALSSLPWWLSIVSWVVLWLVVLVSASFVLFYGIHFGNDKCRKWISSMIMSFITSIFLTQPLKVILLALLFSLIFKKPRMEDDLDLKDEEDHELSSDEEFLHWEPHRGFAAATRARKVAYRPPDPEELERAREQRLKELKMYDILREVLFYSMFLWILLVISYSYRDPNAYLLKKGMEDLFINNDAPHVDGFDNDFTKVDTIEKFWNWTESVLVPGLRAGKWYNGDPPLEQRGFVGDRVGRIMGYATMRQLRVKRGLCEVPEEMIKYVKGCNLPYNFWDEEENHQGIGWAPLGKRNVTAYEYIYRTGKELDSYPYWGLHGMYSGGGYVAELRASRARMAAKVRQLRLQRWIDKYTRVIFIEFTIYNPNVNLFGISTLVAEVLNSGGIFTSYRFEPVNLLSYFTGTMLFQIVCEIIYMFFILFFVIKEVRSMKKQGKEYFKQFWNWVELCIIGFSVSGTIIYFYRLILTRELVTRFKESHGNEYMKFQYVGRWNELLMCMVAWLVFLASLKFLKLLRFNKKIGMMAATLRYGSVHMLAFGFMFSIMFSAFAQFFYLIYHIEMQSFSTIVRSAETCMQMMLGRFNFYAMKTAQPLLGPLFFFVYTVVVAYILINMFLTILNESFSIVRADLAKQSNEYEMVEFILRRFKIWTGLGYHSTDKGFPDVGKHGIQPIFPYELDEFPHKVDRLLNCISKAYFDQDRFESIFDTSSPGHKEMMKKLMMNQKKPLGEQRKADILRVDIGRSFGDADC